MWVDVQSDLRRLAHQRLRLERDGHTLSTTGLVHEVYLRFASQRSVDWSNRGQFFALAAQALRRILVDYARRHRRMRERVRYDSLDAERSGTTSEQASAVRLPGAGRAEELIALDEALQRLGEIDARAARVVECRFFGGYTEEETADALGVTARTVTRDWRKARAWLKRALRDSTASNA